MATATKAKQREETLFMGPEPYLAHCVGCGKFVDKPPLPAPMPAVLAYLAYAAALHAGCRAPVEVAS
jgi:hypothetical protein